MLSNSMKIQYAFQARNEILVRNQLTIMKLYDRKIGHPGSSEALDQVKKTYEELIHAIFAIDREIISIIEDEKTRLLADLNQIDRSEQMIKKFKSRWISECGEKLDNQL